ncbi:MAG: winged helix-turn-helix domain-containing protein [Ktedonobacteraceae bacterium]
MTQNNQTDVFVAFDMLLEGIEVEIDFINKAGAKAFEGRNYDGVREAADRAKQATELRDRLVSLRKEWGALMVFFQDKEEKNIRDEQHNIRRLPKGVRTPESAFRQSILKALVEKGGAGRMNDVLIRVEQLMKGTLKPEDYETLPSDPDMPRWRNTAQWERNSMKEDGLLKSNSRHGVWEITEAGRKALIESHR